MRTIIKCIKILALSISGLVVLALISEYIDYRSSTKAIVATGVESNLVIHSENRKISFLIVGDTGTGLATPRKVALQMERRCRKRTPEGILILGDAIYPDGATSVDDPQWEEKLFSVYRG